MSGIKDSYRAHAFSDVDATGEQARYVSYLDQATDFTRQQKQSRYPLLELRAGDHVLDIGCGTGADVAELAALVGRSGRAVGIDYSEAMVAEARKRVADSSLPIEFKVGDASQLDFPDRSFDACWCERVLVHLAEPARAVAEMARVTKPGGRVVVADLDHEMTAIDAADRAATRAIRNLWIDELRAGWIGRQLSGLFADAGLERVELRPVPIIIREFGLLDILLSVAQSAEAAVQRGAISPEAAAAWLADLRARDAAGRFFACIVGFVAIGMKALSGN